jgi:hypothetical protein
VAINAEVRESSRNTAKISDAPTLVDFFPTYADRPRMELVASSEVPPPYRDLLVHTHHMTVTVEAFHRDRVNVRILESHLTDEWYARRILLTKNSTGEVVQFGIARVRMQYCSPPVREAILEGKIPLGRILIDHDVLRRIAPMAYLRVLPGPAIAGWFGAEAGLLVTYGRLGAIHFDEKPAIEVLEIVAPVRQSMSPI